MDTVSQFSQGPLATPGQGRKSVGDKQPRSEPNFCRVGCDFQIVTFLPELKACPRSISRVYLSSEEPVGGGGRGWRRGEVPLRTLIICLEGPFSEFLPI